MKTVHQKEEAINITSLNIDTINFKTQIQPILQKNCSPCHFPGGKMYQKMPFDKGETIISHEAVAIKRFKEKNEIALLKKFIQQNKLTR
jgi:hypothetical protein